MMNKTKVKSLLWIGLLPIILMGQTDTSELLTDLTVRNIETRFNVCSALTGLGSTASTLGESVVTYHVDASALSWNPSALGKIKHRSLIIDWVPGISQDISKHYDIEGKVQTELNKVMTENGKPDGTVQYPTISPQAGFYSNLSGFSVAIPFEWRNHPISVAAGYTTPVYLNLDLLGNGVETGIETTEEIEDELKTIRMRARVDMQSNIQIAAYQFLIGAGIELQQGWLLGMNLQRHKVYLNAIAQANIDALLEMSGTEYAFNDPNDPSIDFTGDVPETNNLDQNFGFDYQASAWGIKLGLTKEITKEFQFGMTAQFSPKLTFQGTDSTHLHKIPFVTYEDDTLNIDPTEINLAKLTKTESDLKINQWNPTMQLPSSINAGFMWQKAWFQWTLRYSLYFNSLQISLDDKNSWGVKLKQGFGLGLDFRYVFLGAALKLGDEIVDSDETKTPAKIMLPVVNLGFRIPISQQTQLDALIGIEPLPIMRLTYRYLF